MTGHIIRSVEPTDFEAITRLNDLSFGETAQSQIIIDLRKDNDSLWELVCVEQDVIIGHIQFYKVKLEGQDIAAGLGPVCVHPDHQKQGYGSDLINMGLAQLNPAQHQIVFVLGHVSYYPKFGFSSKLGAQYVSPWNHPAFMALKLNEAAPMSGHLSFPRAYL